MSQNNTLSAKAQNIIAKFINKNSCKSSISRTDVMKHAIVTLYAQMPEAKPELIAPFKDCIFDLHAHFTQEEIDVLVAECPQVIMYCLKYSGVMRHIDFNDRYNDLVEEIISEDVPLSYVKKITSAIMLLPLQGALIRIPLTQGDALGYVLVAPSGRMMHNYYRSYFLHFT